MNKNFRYVLVLLSFAFVLTFATSNYAQRPVLGGFKKAAVDNPGVKAAADYAVEAQAEKAEVAIELIEIVSAESQVVAGTNYKMCMKVSSAGDGEEGAEYFVMATVSVDLKQNYRLVSWTDSDCGGVEDAD